MTTLTLHLASDLHLDHWWRKYQTPTLPGGEVLVLAGDIFQASYCKTTSEYWPAYEHFFTQTDKYDLVLLVLGNHDYWGGDLYTTAAKVKNIIPKNMVLLDNQIYTLHNHKIWGGTLWTQVDPEHYTYHSWMNDYRYTTSNYRRMRPDDTNLVHHQHLKGILDHQPTVVISHHAPYPQSVHPQYHNHPCNPYYHSNLTYYPQLWLHGHVHHSLDYYHHNTRVVCNPLGYPTELYHDYTYQPKEIHLTQSLGQT